MQEETVISSTLLGATIHVSVFRPDQMAVYGVVQMVHGLTEHKDMYREMGEYFSGSGYIFIVHNILGHGCDLIDEIPAYLPKRCCKWAVLDIEKVYQECLDEKEKTFSRTIIGFSFGSSMVRALLQKTDAHADFVILAGCGQPGTFELKMDAYRSRKLIHKYGSRNSGKKVKKMFSRNDRYFYEDYQYCWMYADREIARQYEQDPLTGTDIASATIEASVYMSQTAENGGCFKEPEIPVLLMCGTRDAQTPDLGSICDHFAETGCQDVNGISVFGGRHCIFTDACSRSAWKEAIQWMEYRKCGKFSLSAK